jgi:hypothetical protein
MPNEIIYKKAYIDKNGNWIAHAHADICECDGCIGYRKSWFELAMSQKESMENANR